MKVLTNYVNQLTTYRNTYFKNACPTLIESVISEGTHMILPHRDKFGRRVFIYRPGKWNPDRLSFDDLYCVGYMFAELIAIEPKTQVTGVTIIADASGFSFKALRSFSIEDAKNASNFIQSCFPLWFYQLHVVNAPYIFMLAYNIFKPFLSKEVKERMTFHSKLTSLHKHIDPEILPEDFGGKQPPFSGNQCYESVKKIKHIFDEIRTFHKRTPDEESSDEEEHAPEKVEPKEQAPVLEVTINEQQDKVAEEEGENSTEEAPKEQVEETETSITKEVQEETSIEQARVQETDTSIITKEVQETSIELGKVQETESVTTKEVETKEVQELTIEEQTEISITKEGGVQVSTTKEVVIETLAKVEKTVTAISKEAQEMSIEEQKTEVPTNDSEEMPVEQKDDKLGSEENVEKPVKEIKKEDEISVQVAENSNSVL